MSSLGISKLALPLLTTHRFLRRTGYRETLNVDMKLITIKNSLIGHLVVVTLVFQAPSTCKVFKAPSTCSCLCVLNTINFRIPLYFKYYQLEDTFVFKVLSISGYLCISNAINLKIPLFLYLSCYQYAGTFFFGPLYL